MSNRDALSPAERRRYARHFSLPQVGPAGQAKLKKARVLCVGAGGLGSPFLTSLAAAGAGTLGIVDFDTVDESNLQRQTLYATTDVGRPKVEAARDRIRAINPNVEVVPFPVRLSAENALTILADFDVVADGTDNFAARYLVNDACVLLGKPNVYASVYRFEGQASVFDAKHGPCYRCLFPEPPAPGTVPSCEEGGILGVLPSLLGTIQATEALKLVLGIGSPLVGKLLLLDALSMRFREIHLTKDSGCSICGEAPTRTTLVEVESTCAVGGDLPSIQVAELKALFDRGEQLALVDVREPHEAAAARIPGSINIPLGSLEGELGRFSKEQPIVVHCRSGGRSSRAVQMLLDRGFTNVRNLEGGIRRWADVVDPGLQVS